MSKIRLHGSSSGYTEIAPVAASGNNTLTLPNDGTIISKDSNGAVGVTSITVGTGVTIGDGRVTCTTVHGSAASLTQIPAANIVGVCTAGLASASGVLSGVTMADQWRVTADFTPSQASTITSNWERNDNYFDNALGSGMSESSGEFTFPQTGIYKVTVFYGGYKSSGSSSYSGVQLRVSDNSGSSYTQISASYQSIIAGPTNPHFSGVTDALIDVTNASTFRVKLLIDRNSETVFFGSSTGNFTGVTFIRLGDT